MTCTCQWIRTVIMSAAVVLSASVASAQSVNHEQAPAPEDHSHSQAVQPSPGDHSMAAMHKHMMTRMATADARLTELVADMNMFTGELKIEAMARLLTALVERQLMMREQVVEAPWRMMPRSMDAAPDAADQEDGAMCSERGH